MSGYTCSPEERRAQQRALYARKRAAKLAAPPSGELTYVGNPTEGVYTVHRVSCHTLKDRSRYIGAAVHWKAKRRLCGTCRPTMAEAAALVVRVADPPGTSRSVENGGGDQAATYRRVMRAFRPERRYDTDAVPMGNHIEWIVDSLMSSPSAEDEYFASL